MLKWNEGFPLEGMNKTVQDLIKFKNLKQEDKKHYIQFILNVWRALKVCGHNWTQRLCSINLNYGYRGHPKWVFWYEARLSL